MPLPSLDSTDDSGSYHQEVTAIRKKRSATPIGSKLATPIANGSRPCQNELDASSTAITITECPQDLSAISELAGDTMFMGTDHMLTAQWKVSTGWQQPQLKPYGPLSIMPTANVLHYSTTCFEGMKLYRGYDGVLRLFRPMCNANRMLLSANRISLPSFPPEELLALIVKICAFEGPKWLPRNEPGRVLYIRPTLIGDDPKIGVKVPDQALLFIILGVIPTTLGGLLKGGMRLLASDEETSGIRAWPGGHGWAKIGANYGPTLLETGKAAAKGFTQVLWLLPKPNGKVEVTEAGASNFFVVWKTRDGETEMVTAPLNERVILDGVTRRSILQLARERLENGDVVSGVEKKDKLKVSERPLKMQELEEAVTEGRMVEAFAAGTAYFVAPVSLIRYHEKDLPIPMVEGNTGMYARILRNWLADIMFGKEKHEWGYEVAEEP